MVDSQWLTLVRKDWLHEPNLSASVVWLCMTTRKDKDAKSALRHAATAACSKRGANVGTVVDVIDELHERNLLESSVSKGALRQSHKRARSDWKDKYCTIIPLSLETGDTFQWCTLSPHSAIQFFLDRVNEFEQFLSLRQEGTPLEMIVYTDEIVPGNPLHPDNARRCSTIYISFLQWKTFLFSELVWLPVAILRTSIIKSVSGGFSHCMRKLFESWKQSFEGDRLHIQNQRTYVFPIRYTVSVMDESAQHQTWSVKGSAGRRPCLKCKNAVAKYAGDRLDLASDVSSYFRDICCPDIDEFDPMLDTDAFEAVDHLRRERPAISKRAFDDLQKNLGFVHNSKGILAAEGLRHIISPSTATFDLLHCFWNSGGIACVEVSLFVTALISDGVTWQDIQNAAGIQVSSMHPSNPGSRKRLLTEAFFSGNAGWKASGSEHMMILPLLHLWLMLHLKESDRWERLHAQCLSFQLLCERLYCLFALQFTGNAMFHDLLKSKQAAHFKQFISTYGRTYVRPKHHYSLHAPGQWKKYGFCLDTKTQERKHQAVKREIEASGQNLVCFEERILRQVLLVQESELTKRSPNFCRLLLLKPSPCGPHHWQSSVLQAGLLEWKKEQAIVREDGAWAGIIYGFEQIRENISVIAHTFSASRVIGLGLTEWSSKRKDPLKIRWLDLKCYRPQHWIASADSLLTIW